MMSFATFVGSLVATRCRFQDLPNRRFSASYLFKDTKIITGPKSQEEMSTMRPGCAPSSGVGSRMLASLNSAADIIIISQHIVAATTATVWLGRLSP
jgi:hypothetical protein